MERRDVSELERQSIIAAAGYTCQCSRPHHPHFGRCGASLRFGCELHHVLPVTLFGESPFPFLEPLCLRCHSIETSLQNQLSSEPRATQRAAALERAGFTPPSAFVSTPPPVRKSDAQIRAEAQFRALRDLLSRP